jgi:hypothetical protein
MVLESLHFSRDGGLEVLDQLQVDGPRDYKEESTEKREMT